MYLIPGKISTSPTLATIMATIVFHGIFICLCIFISIIHMSATIHLFCVESSLFFFCFLPMLLDDKKIHIHMLSLIFDNLGATRF